MSFSTSLQTVLAGLDNATDDAGCILLGPKSSAALREFFEHAIGTAAQLEEMVGVDQVNAASLIAFAKQGEPCASAEVLDLSEIMAREHVSRPTPQVLTEAKLYAFPTVPRATFDFSQLDGGDAA